MTEPTHVPLSHLSIAEINVRKTDRGADPALVASIKAKGVIVPLTVRPNLFEDGFYTVTDGGKRYAALVALLNKKDIEPDYQVPIIVRNEDDQAARDTSLAANVMRTMMHPVDQYEAFAAIAETGEDNAAIAARYGIGVKQVEQALALGRLAPEVLTAWRGGKIDADEARAFTLEPDMQRQAQILKGFAKRRISSWAIREQILGDERAVAGMLKFVGLDDYQKAGGQITSDLFADSNSSHPTNTKLLKQLYEIKLNQTFKKLQSEGWKWVAMREDLPHSADWWEHKAKSSIKAEHRGNFGVIIGKKWDGEIEIKYGVIKPGAAKAKAKKAAKEGGETALSSLSAALCLRMSAQITEAASDVMKGDHALALAALAAALVTFRTSPVRINNRGGYETDKDDGFTANLALMRAKSRDEIIAILSEVTAAALDLGGGSAELLPLADGREDHRAILEALDPAKLHEALRSRFNAADYFIGVRKDDIVQAAKECGVAGDPSAWEKMKKGDLAKMAAAGAAEATGWLPPEMRTAHYQSSARPVEATTATGKKPVKKPRAARKAAKPKAAAKRPAKKKPSKRGARS